MHNKINWIIIGCIILFSVGYYWIITQSPRIEQPEDKILNKIEILNNKVDSIKRANDSIKIIIDTTEIEIKHYYNEYIQIRDNIIVQSSDSDCIFFSNYLSENSRRFIDTINFEPIETY